MIPIYRMKVIQIEVTNACNLKCSNCTRFVGHHKKPFMMDIETVEKALMSLEGYPEQIGIMGGEPTLHPEFGRICELVRKLVPDKKKRSLWTNGLKWDEYKTDIYETFLEENIIYNDHKDEEVGEHQPLLMAAEDIIPDRELMWRLIGNCWIQWRWAAAITPKGGFFCEVAAAADMLFDGPGGYALEKGWWNKNPNEFLDQVKRYCPKCSAAVPMPGVSSHAVYDVISPSNAKRLKEIDSPKFNAGRYEIRDVTYNEDQIEDFVRRGWTPWSHRPYKQCAPDKKWQ